jgi:Fe-S cluster biogenesis protein NfuA/nitrite reductase/ring-hydroxylating ferredoxin subunit
VGPVLIDHGLLEEPVEGTALQQRVADALDRVRPYMHGHGGDVDLLEVRDGIARLRLQGACHGCASSSLTLRMGVERILREAVPELAGIEVEGSSPPKAVADGFISLDAIGKAGGGWRTVAQAEALSFGATHLVANGASLLLCAAFGRAYAVRDRCPVGGGSLRGARLEAFLLVCPCHGERFDLRSGRSLTAPERSLELLPIVVEQGQVRVAVG